MKKKETMETKKRGGKRPGAGRKAGVKVGPYKENPRTKMIPFRVTEKTLERMKQLRELTKEDTMPFVDMLEAWVKEMARDYGIE